MLRSYRCSPANYGMTNILRSRRAKLIQPTVTPRDAGKGTFGLLADLPTPATIARAHPAELEQRACSRWTPRETRLCRLCRFDCDAAGRSLRRGIAAR